MACGSTFASNARERLWQFQRPAIHAILRARWTSPRRLSEPLLFIHSLYEIILILRYGTTMYKLLFLHGRREYKELALLAERPGRLRLWGRIPVTKEYCNVLGPAKRRGRH